MLQGDSQLCAMNSRNKGLFILGEHVAATVSKKNAYLACWKTVYRYVDLYSRGLLSCHKLILEGESLVAYEIGRGMVAWSPPGENAED